MWRFHLGHGRLDTTRQLAEMCLTLAEEQQAPELLQEYHFMCGLTLYYLGELELALTHLEQSLALYQSQSRAQSRDGLVLSGGTEPGVVCLSAMAWVLWKLGHWKAAKARSREAITLAETLAHDYSLCYALAISGYFVERMVALANEHGFVRWLQAGLILRGWNLAARGQVEAGVAQIRQSVTMFQSMGWDLGMPHMLSVLVEAYRHSGELEAGLEVVDEALALIQRTQERCNESELHRLRGELLQDQSALRSDAEAIHEEVETHFQHALEIARRQMSRSQELRAAVSLSRLWHEQGKRAEAYELLKAIYEVFEAESGSPELLEAQAMIDLLG
ncbi:hypothetical protein C2W62_42665 [Candidatus Entotheonella serta]|nr:hypothetical protein C2W62_42665 [Candidatus Entotheonella serta]